ncbi:unnamed protein product, partial [Thlaspi arvense]
MRSDGNALMRVTERLSTGSSHPPPRSIHRAVNNGALRPVPPTRTSPPSERRMETGIKRRQKTITHRPYSDYNSSDEQSLTFDSYMIPEEDLELGQSRLLEVDNRVVVPAKTHLRIIVTSADVPHSWAVPSSGVKCDAVPGRLNQISILVQREGVYYGQCSEICGTNHAFTRAPGNIGRLLSPLWLSRTTGCEPPEKQAITASGWSCREPRSKAVDKIEEGARHPVEQRGRLG